MGNRSTSTVDLTIGLRLRLRRLEQRLSQEQLASKLGVSFQQVQKYEKGTNRIGASRLHQIAKLLEVPLTFFFDCENGAQEVDTVLFLNSAYSVRLQRAFAKIKHKEVRRQLVIFTETIAHEE
jgi:transcriptional regulator with XRE-family HTH domain